MIIPRVGATIIEHGPFFDKVQGFFKSHRIRVIELCKGADRCRKPPIPLAPHEAPHRASIGIHRVTKATVIKDWENWEVLKGRSLIEKTQPARLLVTIFGSPVNTDQNQHRDKRPIESQNDEGLIKRSKLETEKEPIEPKDRQLCQKYILDAIDDFRCSTCHELEKPRIPRPAAIPGVTEFNQCVGCDLVTWSTKQGKKHTFFHVVDMATSFQLAQRVYQTSHEALRDAFSRTWMLWAGPPQELVIDGESALCSEAFCNFTQRHSITTRVVAVYANWQMGKRERHGG